MSLINVLKEKINMAKKDRRFTVSCDIETTSNGSNKRDAINNGVKSIKGLGLEATQINAREDYDNRSQLKVEITLEGSKTATGTQSIIEEIISTCEKLDIELTRIQCYEE
tara:strand:+ start:295 stop:624 length:330 start_codon:yes stop_codon:yes gene_type:complete